MRRHVVCMELRGKVMYALKPSKRELGRGLTRGLGRVHYIAGRRGLDESLNLRSAARSAPRACPEDGSETWARSAQSGGRPEIRQEAASQSSNLGGRLDLVTVPYTQGAFRF